MDEREQNKKVKIKIWRVSKKLCYYLEYKPYFWRCIMSENEHRLLKICEYGINANTIELESRIQKNYSQYDELLNALEDLQEILDHSDFYLSLQSERDMIKIKIDTIDDEEYMVVDTDIIVWANEHKIDYEEGLEEICILGFSKTEDP